ncbi:MAG TPA: CHAT domain-containing protein, partial [Blastocatellia bacterium]|nr:CHAT domain-containing protein [Blastocatellia bacterium]
KFGQKTRSAQALADIALTKKYLGLYEEALQEYFKILAIYEELDDKLGICGTLQLIGAAYLSLGRYQEALDYTEKSQKLAEELGAKPAIAAGLQQLSELHRFAGNYAKALSYADRALKLDTELGLQSRVASVLGVIGSVYYSQHNTDQAREYYDKCLAIREQLGEKLGLIDALNSRGLVETMNGAHDKAIEYYKRGLNLAEELGDNVGIRISLSYLASDYIALGDTERARVLLERGLGLAEEQGDRLAIGHLLLGLAEIRYKSGDYIKALDLADRSAQLAKETYAQGFVQACTSRGRALRRLNRPEEAFKALSEAINTVESLRYQVIGPEQDRARFYADKASSYLEMVDLLVEKGRLGEALAFAERFKGRTLLEALQTGVTDKTLTAAMTADEREREGKLDADLRSLNIQLFVENQSKRNDEARLTILRENLQKRRLEYEAFRTGLYAAHPELGVKRGDLRTVNLDEAATLVAQRKSAVLEYVVGPEGCYLFLLTQGNRRNRAPLGNNQPESRRSNSEMERLKLQVFPIDVKEDKLTSLVEALRTRLANRSFEYQTLTSQLYDLLLGPARDQLRGQTSLIIIPDGPLWSLPFQALQGHNRHFLIEDFAISYAPSLTVLREMIEAEKKSEKPAVDPESLLAFGNPDFGSTGEAVLVLGEPLGPIPDAERQVRQLSQLYGPGHWKIYTGRDALEERVKVEAGKYGILHFATHGVFDDASPMHSYLVLARDAAGKDDGLLEASEVMNLDLRAKLAVLSACETGRGQVTSGEGLIGFTWAFFVAGCPSTVVSLWKVESGSATEMMLEFHRNLRQDLRANAGMSKAEALRRSALKLLRSERYRHPAFWAAFVIVGEGR